MIQKFKPIGRTIFYGLEKMKIAVVTDFLIDRGGAEREILIIAKKLKADVITTQFIPKKTYKEFSSLNVIAFPLKTYPIQLLMQSEAVRKFMSVNLSKYDIVISMGDWARFVALNKTLKGKHVLITISPPRMFSDLKSSIEEQLNFIQCLVFRTWSHFAAKNDRKVIAKIDHIIVQSMEAKHRVESYYRKEVYFDILYPPTEVEKFKSGKSNGYFLSVQRIMPAKRVELQIEAFNKMPDKKLVVVGSVLDSKLSYLKELKSMANKNITFRINVKDKELIDLYSHAEAVIQTSVKEDFGLIPVEAMASGKPCIAVNEGGFKETIDKKTGILIDEPYAENLINTVRIFKKFKFKKKDLISRSKQFSSDIFIRKLKKIIFEGVKK